MTSSCFLVEILRKIYDSTSKTQGQNLIPSQGHVKTKIGHVAYQSMGLDEQSQLFVFLNTPPPIEGNCSPSENTCGNTENVFNMCLISFK